MHLGQKTPDTPTTEELLKGLGAQGSLDHGFVNPVSAIMVTVSLEKKV